MKMQNLFLFLSIGLLLSCNQQAQTQANAQAKVQPHNQAKDISKQRQHVHAVTKPHASIFMDYEIVNPVELNRMLDIKLTFMSKRNTDMLSVEYSLDAGLSANGEPRQFEFKQLAKGETKSIVLKVMPEQAGEFSINVYASIEINGKNQSRAFIVPISVPQSANSIQSQAVTEKPQGNAANKGMRFMPEQNVISMPANESSN